MNAEELADTGWRPSVVGWQFVVSGTVTGTSAAIPGRAGMHRRVSTTAGGCAGLMFRGGMRIGMG